ncbi:unnamed protein product [Ostreobium quekettii]|uniref:Uncharacterized protein n=1 Tax=Ostreobium quekettii TaxID=121088 RepID=A0A8S1J1K6_9CHLO|nr:unnamed protein product [Ostreobium quekettii]|eukprot:evm.model.scf_226EXC.16 EVM.evm.TU.scf_226EXC.16   scf_226EXC:103086-105915(-)
MATIFGFNLVVRAGPNRAEVKPIPIQVAAHEGDNDHGDDPAAASPLLFGQSTPLLGVLGHLHPVDDEPHALSFEDGEGTRKVKGRGSIQAFTHMSTWGGSQGTDAHGGSHEGAVTSCTDLGEGANGESSTKVKGRGAVRACVCTTNWPSSSERDGSRDCDLDVEESVSAEGAEGHRGREKGSRKLSNRGEVQAFMRLAGWAFNSSSPGNRQPTGCAIAAGSRPDNSQSHARESDKSGAMDVTVGKELKAGEALVRGRGPVRFLGSEEPALTNASQSGMAVDRPIVGSVGGPDPNRPRDAAHGPARSAKTESRLADTQDNVHSKCYTDRWQPSDTVLDGNSRGSSGQEGEEDSPGFSGREPEHGDHTHSVLHVQSHKQIRYVTTATSVRDQEHLNHKGTGRELSGTSGEADSEASDPRPQPLDLFQQMVPPEQGDAGLTPTEKEAMALQALRDKWKLLRPIQRKSDDARTDHDAQGVQDTRNAEAEMGKLNRQRIMCCGDGDKCQSLQRTSHKKSKAKKRNRDVEVSHRDRPDEGKATCHLGNGFQDRWPQSSLLPVAGSRRKRGHSSAKAGTSRIGEEHSYDHGQTPCLVEVVSDQGSPQSYSHNSDMDVTTEQEQPQRQTKLKKRKRQAGKVRDRGHRHQYQPCLEDDWQGRWLMSSPDTPAQKAKRRVAPPLHEDNSLSVSRTEDLSTSPVVDPFDRWDSG